MESLTYPSQGVYQDICLDKNLNRKEISFQYVQRQNVLTWNLSLYISSVLVTSKSSTHTLGVATWFLGERVLVVVTSSNFNLGCQPFFSSFPRP